MKKAIGEILVAIGRALGGGTGSGEEGIEPCGTIDINTASSILLDKLEEMGSEGEIYLPDAEIKVYYRDEVESCFELKEVAAITYVAEVSDCDDFAAMLYGKFASLCWTNLHSLSFFLDEDYTFWWIEPQTGNISRTLEGWQGSAIRFLLMR